MHCFQVFKVEIVTFIAFSNISYPDHPRWHTDNCCPGRDIMDNDGVGANYRTVADPNAAQHSRSGANEDIVTDDWESPLVAHTDRYAGDDRAIAADLSGVDDRSNRVGDIESTAHQDARRYF